MYARSRFGGSFSGGSTPITIGLMVGAGVLFLLSLFGAGQFLLPFLVFSGETFPAFFWTVFTWPLVTAGGAPLYFLFALGWFYFISGSLERSWGTRDYGVVVGSLAALMAVLAYIGHLTLHTGGLLAGLTLLAGPLAVAWAIVNQRETVSIWMLPVPAWMIGCLGVVETYYYGGMGVAGLFVLPACAAMYWYVTQGRYGSTGGRVAAPFRDRAKSGLRLDDFGRTPARSDRGSRPASLDDVPPAGFNLKRWWRERQEKKRLEEIFRRSGFTDDDERR